MLLFDFGAQVAGYRSDMTRTLFVGEPTERDLAIYELVARAQASVIEALEAAVAAGAGSVDGPPLPDGRSLDAIGRDLIAAAGHGAHFGHGTGHGIGLATHEAPSLGKTAVRRRRCPARRSSRWSRASTSTARWASGSRTSSCSTGPPGGSSG